MHPSAQGSHSYEYSASINSDGRDLFDPRAYPHPTGSTSSWGDQLEMHPLTQSHESSTFTNSDDRNLFDSHAYPHPTASTSSWDSQLEMHLPAQSGYGHGSSTPTNSDIGDFFAPRIYPHPSPSTLGWGDQPGTHQAAQGGYGHVSAGAPGPNTSLLLKEWTNEELMPVSGPLLPESEGVDIGTTDHGLVANLPSPQVLDMEIIEVGYALTVRTVDERYASEGEKVYDIEVLKELNILGPFAQNRAHVPLGYLLIESAQPPTIVPFYVSKTISGLITSDGLDFLIKGVNRVGYFQPQRRFASSTVEHNPEEFTFIAPLFVVDNVRHKNFLDVLQDGSIRSWMLKRDSQVEVKDLVVWDSKLHPPYDYATSGSQKRVRSYAAGNWGEEEQSESIEKERSIEEEESGEEASGAEEASGEDEAPTKAPKALYVPGGNPIFHIDGSIGWEKPAVPARAPIKRDITSRNNMLFLRRDLHYVPPNSEPVNVPDVYGGTFTVEDYVASILDSSMTLLGFNPKIIPLAQKVIIIAETTTLITAHYSQCRLWALWEVEAPTTIGGYGLPRTLDPAARRAGAAALLVDDKFAYEGGVDHKPDALKYSHSSIGRINTRIFVAKVKASVHPHKLSKQTISTHFNIPSIATEFSPLGGATVLSIIHDLLVSISTGVAEARVSRRLAFYKDMISPSHARVRAEVWPKWMGKRDLSVIIPGKKTGSAGPSNIKPGGKMAPKRRHRL